jgi:hypothetical protein
VSFLANDGNAEMAISPKLMIGRNDFFMANGTHIDNHIICAGQSRNNPRSSFNPEITQTLAQLDQMTHPVAREAKSNRRSIELTIRLEELGFPFSLARISKSRIDVF